VIVSKCPLRVSLAGGSTDLDQFIDKYGRGSVINFTCNLNTYVTINRDVFGFNKKDKKYIVNYKIREEVEKLNNIKNDIVRECYDYFKIEPNTCTLTSDVFSSGSGLASSSSYLLSFIKSSCLYKGIKLNDETLCQLALKIERKFNPLTGYQDAYGCGIGSLKRIDIDKDKNVIIKKLPTDIFKNFNMYLIHTGVSRSSTKILKTINFEKAKKLLPLVDEMENILKKKDTDKFLTVIKDGWKYKKMSSKNLLTHIEVINLDNELSDNKDIYAHRLCGAGDGGFYLAFTSKTFEPPKNYIKIDIVNEGVKSVLL
jgi:D-glycero-alpha-D-manno-heptose-7-phosphate kinase